MRHSFIGIGAALGLSVVLCAGLLGCDEGSSMDGAAASAASSGGDMPCGTLGCSHGARVTLAPQGRFFEPGDYEVRFREGGSDQVCTFTLGGGPEDCGLDHVCILRADAGCTALQVQFNFVLEPHTIGFVVGPPQDAEEGSSQGTDHGTGPTTDAAPDGELIEVDVRRGGQSVFGDAIAPHYEPYTPNGPDCPPLCWIAQVQLTIG